MLRTGLCLRVRTPPPQQASEWSPYPSRMPSQKRHSMSASEKRTAAIVCASQRTAKALRKTQPLCCGVRANANQTPCRGSQGDDGETGKHRVGAAPRLASRRPGCDNLSDTGSSWSSSLTLRIYLLKATHSGANSAPEVAQLPATAVRGKESSMAVLGQGPETQPSTVNAQRRLGPFDAWDHCSLSGWRQENCSKLFWTWSSKERRALAWNADGTALMENAERNGEGTARRPRCQAAHRELAMEGISFYVKGKGGNFVLRQSISLHFLIEQFLLDQNIIII